MGRKPKPPPDDPEQSKRFVETAKALGTDASGTAFSKEFKKIVPIKATSKARQKREA